MFGYYPVAMDSTWECDAALDVLVQNVYQENRLIFVIYLVTKKKQKNFLYKLWRVTQWHIATYSDTVIDLVTQLHSLQNLWCSEGQESKFSFRER